MPQEISTIQIIESTLNGINESMNTYKKWSGGEWLWNAPEYLITIKIAENIAKINGEKYITLEDNVDYILNSANAKGRGRISDKTRTNGRSDIVIWWTNSTPRAIIEVKNSVFRLDKISKDIDRIGEILTRKQFNSSIEFGLIAFYIDRGYKTGNAKKRLKVRINKILNDIKEQYKNINCELHYNQEEIIEDDKDSWASVVFLLKAE